MEKHCSEEENDGFVTERFRRGNFVNMKPEDYYANNGSPVDHTTDSHRPVS